MANGCGCSMHECSGASECRFYKKATSIIKLFCRALGRTDLFDKYSKTLAVHNGGVPDVGEKCMGVWNNKCFRSPRAVLAALALQR